VEENEKEAREPEEDQKFDEEGNVTNSIEQKVKINLLREREILTEMALEINPKFQPPNKVKIEPKKLTKKIYIPIDRFPDYNFIGLIIGPRGKIYK
jgi:splicing factor 1